MCQRINNQYTFPEGANANPLLLNRRRRTSFRIPHFQTASLHPFALRSPFVSPSRWNFIPGKSVQNLI